MRCTQSSVTDLCYAIVNACRSDLTEISYPYNSPADHRAGKAPVIKTRRPEMYDDLRVFLFQQMWSSTALGFGGMSGASMTEANTVVIIGPMGDACVYFSTRLAYHILRPNDAFFSDLGSHHMVAVSGAKLQYEKE